jgi:ferredoxin-NADP reductase
MVKVQIDGKPLVRCYSIVSTPATAAYIEISVRSQGIVSKYLHDTLRPGSTIEMRGPGGGFVYPEGNRPVVLVAGGIGITPLLCMLRHGLTTEPSRPMVLLLSVKTAANVPFLDELRVLERRHPLFRCAIALSRGSSDPAFYSGRIDKALIETVAGNVSGSVYMLCGPLAMIDGTKELLESMGVPSAQIHFEKFEAAVSSATAATGGAAQAKITLKRSGHTVRVAAGQTILDAAEAAGASLPSMCRVGVCGTCRTRLLSGEVEGDFDALDPADQAEGCILPCVARAVSDCAIDA